MKALTNTALKLEGSKDIECIRVGQLRFFLHLTALLLPTVSAADGPAVFALKDSDSYSLAVVAHEVI